MTDTPNTSRPSEAAMQVAKLLMYIIRNGTVDEEDLASVIDDERSRAREEARREALEEAAQTLLRERDCHRRNDDPHRADAAGYCSYRIRALIHPTPQGETKEQQP